MSINRPGETTVELATPSQKLFVFLHLNFVGSFMFLLLYKYITKIIGLKQK